MTSPIAGNIQPVSPSVSPTQAEAQGLSDDGERPSTSSGTHASARTSAVATHQQENSQMQQSSQLFLANVGILLKAANRIEGQSKAKPSNEAGITTQQNPGKRKAKSKTGTTTGASQDSVKPKKTKKKRSASSRLPRKTPRQSVSSMPSMKLKQHMRLHEPKSPSTRTNQPGGSQQDASSCAKPFTCNQCGKGFVNQSKLNEHIPVHTGVRPYQCPDCEKSYKNRSSLYVHKRTHEGTRPYRCLDCGRLFMYRQSLIVHQHTHAGEKPYNCRFCDKSFREQGDLTRHERTHTGEKPYACSSCKKAFATSSELVVHTRVHTNVRPYPCSSCGKSFKTNHNLRRHQKKSCAAQT